MVLLLLLLLAGPTITSPHAVSSHLTTAWQFARCKLEGHETLVGGGRRGCVAMMPIARLRGGGGGAWDCSTSSLDGDRTPALVASPPFGGDETEDYTQELVLGEEALRAAGCNSMPGAREGEGMQQPRQQSLPGRGGYVDQNNHAQQHQQQQQQQQQQQRWVRGSMQHHTHRAAAPFDPIKPWGSKAESISMQRRPEPKPATIEDEVLERMEKNLGDRSADWSLRVKSIQASNRLIVLLPLLLDHMPSHSAVLIHVPPQQHSPRFSLPLAVTFPQSTRPSSSPPPVGQPLRRLPPRSRLTRPSCLHLPSLSSQELSNLITNDGIPQDVRASAVHRLVPCLSSQLEDKRSTLVKEVCLLISRSAESLGHLFEPCAPKLLRMLLQLTYVTVKVISQSGQDCISALVSSVSRLYLCAHPHTPHVSTLSYSLPLHLHLGTPLNLWTDSSCLQLAQSAASHKP
jgi:hypothetical protein